MALKLVFNPLSGQFDYVDIAATGAPAVPLTIASGDTFTVPDNTQVAYAIEIENNGTIVNNGQLVMLRSA